MIFFVEGVAKGFDRSQLKLLIRAKETQLARRAQGEVPADSSSATSEADTSPDPEEPAESSSPTYSPSSATPSSSDSAVSSGQDPPGGLGPCQAARAASAAAAAAATTEGRVRLSVARAEQLRAQVASAARQAITAALAAGTAADLSSSVPQCAEHQRLRLEDRRRLLEKGLCKIGDIFFFTRFYGS